MWPPELPRRIHAPMWLRLRSYPSHEAGCLVHDGATGSGIDVGFA